MAKYILALPSEEVSEVHYGCPEAVEIGGSSYRQVDYQVWERHRWSVSSLWVIERTDPNGSITYWSTLLEQGATENQDHNTFRDEEFIEFERVDKIPTITYNWKVIT